ncbi:TauD/TfdA family dioxygenase [Novosphingobium sp. PASSN1]|uniref:TauD/TfdA dioxygenase family protein n=1 Tax=Novosphingobium sp. PASSN1 TaxID=2015561 RepID=UPI000BC7725D|nr:TauD/TfdA family dioxygenase [Novosphingobium sp. PASSN1]OYU34798.1 MAG: hypothetical protein CFE35_12970 [Novosphingobium sp. PASSN1]
MSSLLRTRPIEPFGVEILEDLSSPLSGEQQEQFRQLFLMHELIVARSQSLDRGTHQSLASLLGPLCVAGDSDELDNTSKLDLFKNSGLAYHSDNMYGPDPHHALSLHALDVTPDSTCTNFISTTRAARDIPAHLRARLLGRDVKLVLGLLFDRRNRLRDQPVPVGLGWPERWWPVFSTHPENGREFLTISLNAADCISGLDDDQSEALLEEVFRFLYRAEAIYSHQWRTGDVVFWDNLATQHGRPMVPDGVIRRLQRVSIGGLGFAIMFPELATLPVD